MQHWVIPEKIHTSTTEGMVENLMGRAGFGGGGGGGGLWRWKSRWGGGSEPKDKF